MGIFKLKKAAEVEPKEETEAKAESHSFTKLSFGVRNVGKSVWRVPALKIWSGVIL